MELKPGLRLRSVACATEMIVVRTPGGDVDLRCGGLPVAAVGSTDTAELDAAHANGTLMGKRYGTETLEILCTKPGAGSLSIGNEPIEVKGAKALPSSD